MCLFVVYCGFGFVLFSVGGGCLVCCGLVSWLLLGLLFGCFWIDVGAYVYC